MSDDNKCYREKKQSRWLERDREKVGCSVLMVKEGFI